MTKFLLGVAFTILGVVGLFFSFSLDKILFKDIFIASKQENLSTNLTDNNSEKLSPESTTSISNTEDIDSDKLSEINQIANSSSPKLGDLNSIHSYLRSKSNLFPISPVDGLTFFMPTLIDEKTVKNEAQIHLSSSELKEVNKKTLLGFLVNFVGLMHRFNCENLKPLLDNGISIFNMLETREGNRQNLALPAITFNGQNIELAEGFITQPQICANLKDEKNSLVVKEATTPELRLQNLFHKQQPTSFGTGWVMENGLIVTNHHVVASGTRFFAMKTDRTFVEAKILVEDASEDLALLKVDDLSFLPTSLKLSNKPIELAEEVSTIGYPWTSSVTNVFPELQVSKGIVSSFPTNGRLIQLSMPVQQGNSGGPLFNKKGEVVGVIVAKLSKNAAGVNDIPENVSYAIKLSRLNQMLEYFSKDIKVPSVATNSNDSNLDSVISKVQKSALLIIGM